MINMFDMVNRKPVPSVHCHFIPELKAIMDNFPDEYLPIYAYIFYKTCPDSTLNPYSELPEEAREEVIIRDLKPSFYLEDMSIETAINKCNELYETPTLRAWRGAKKMYDKVAKYLDEKEITDGKDSNAAAIRWFMKDLVDYRETYNKLDQALKEEQAQARGKVKIAYDLKPNYSNTKEEHNE